MLPFGLTLVRPEERTCVRLQKVEERGSMDAKLKIEGVTSAKHEDGYVAGVRDEHVRERKVWCME